MKIFLPTSRGDRVQVLGAGRPRLVVWFPGAFTPVCSVEIEGIVEPARRAREGGVDVLAASCDSPAVLRAWLEAHAASAVIGLSDFWPHGHVAHAMGAFDPARGTALRQTFAITAAGESTLVERAASGQPRSPERLAAAVEHLLQTGTGS